MRADDNRGLYGRGVSGATAQPRYANIPCCAVTDASARASLDAGVAQLVEQLIRNQQVSGSSPLAGSILFNNLAAAMRR